MHAFASMEDMVDYINQNPVEYRPEEKALLQKIESMSMEERWEYWQSEISRCIKCYACRAACPNCYCDRCIVDVNQPQWIPTASHEIGNLEWHIIRAMHLAGRCVNCGACADACPVDIPLNLLTLKLTEEINKNFGVSEAFSLTDNYALSTFNTNDKETFIK
jgi:ferredoxin